MNSKQKIDRSMLGRASASMRGSYYDRARALLPWVGLCTALGLVASGLWLRDVDQQAQAPLRRTEVQVDKLKTLNDAGWQQWLGSDIVATKGVEKVADAWVSLTREHPSLPSVAPTRLAQVDGGRVTVTYVKQASADDVTAHAGLAADQMGVVQVWTDQKGFDAWREEVNARRQSSIVIGLLSLAVGIFAAFRLWKGQWEQSRSWRVMMVQLGLAQRMVEARFRRILGVRIAGAMGATALLFLSIHHLISSPDSTPNQEVSQVSSVFRPRSMEIPLASDFPCDGACQRDPRMRTEHAYLVEHKLAVLARQDRALDRHEKALRPWMWSLSRQPSTHAQRTVLSANLLDPELQTRFSAWDIEDRAFRRSLREVDALATRMQAEIDRKKKRGVVSGTTNKIAQKSCDAGQAPWALGSLSPWVNGKFAPRPKRERLEGLVDPAMRLLAKRGTKVKSSVGADVAAILRDTPGRFTLVLDSGQSWIWALGGIDALEVNTGDRVNVGDILGEVARPGPLDEGAASLRVELWQGGRQADPMACFAGAPKSTARRNKTLGSAHPTRYNAR